MNKIKNAIKLLEENIKADRVQGKFEEEQIYSTSPSVTKKYNKFIKNIRILVNEKNKKNKKEEIITILNNNHWGSELKKYCEKNIGQFLAEKKYAYLLDLNLIISNVENKEIKQIYEFYYSLQKVYSISSVKDYFIEDKRTLIDLKKNYQRYIMLTK